MSLYDSHHPETTERIKLLLAVALLLLMWSFGLVSWASAQRRTPTTTPALITPPPGNAAFLVGHAVGTQGYVCLPTSTGFSWTVNGSRPEANLSAGAAGQEVPIISHYLSPDTNPNQFAPKLLPFGSPTWQSSVDGSKVWGQALNAIPSGSDPSCPHDGAIACVLLQSIGSQLGPAGGKTMTRTTFIQRLNTQGGSAPATGCSAPADVGKQTLVPYTADYYFFGPTNKSPKSKTTRFDLR